MTEDGTRTLQAIWAGQVTHPLHLSAAQLRARMEQFEKEIRRRNFRDYVSFALVLAGCGGAVLMVSNLLLRLGAALMAAWAIYCMHGLYRFGFIQREENPWEDGAQACVAHHRRQLERQRDIVLSWPWGIGLAIPGFVLFSLGVVYSRAQPDWSIPIALIGCFAFLYVVLVIQGRARAAQWQREIDALAMLEGDARASGGKPD
ncbi:MAG TPA: hypothetical protein PKE27_13995 [Povalibacter sp.]|uniref:hypothetical protein n=1 Tax=Povalibacter sp. TaxID=1962978 RepID=UPI002CB51774|nr:hypothetical protein [Povalibacter sp.]HMN45688.1 hypothetical protein [Povalibacter sp.]